MIVSVMIAFFLNLMFGELKEIEKIVINQYLIISLL